MMVRCIAALLLVLPLLAGCAKSGAVVVTPLNSYTKEDILTKADAYCREYGMLPAEVKEDKEIWARLIDEVVREYVYADIQTLNADEINDEAEPEVSEAEIRSKYETLLFSEKQYFAEKKEVVTGAILYPRDVIVYYPEGLKWVTLFTVPFEAGTRGQAAIFLSEEKLGDYERLIEAAETEISPEIQNLRQRLKRGTAFAELASEYGGSQDETLLYDEDTGLFPAQLGALKTLKSPGDIAEYNIYQGHVFMLFVRTPDYVEVPYEAARDEIEASIRKNKAILEHDRLMKRLYSEAIASGSVKVRIKEINKE
jgi:hypothetical protein